jgi:hypothetical protein
VRAEEQKRKDADTERRREEWVRISRERDEREKLKGKGWHKDAQKFLDDETGTVPFPKPFTRGCTRTDPCVRGEMLGVCHHDVEHVLRNAREYGDVYLKERLRWHPDKFSGRGDVQIMAQEMFQMIQRLIDGPRMRVRA